MFTQKLVIFFTALMSLISNMHLLLIIALIFNILRRERHLFHRMLFCFFVTRFKSWNTFFPMKFLFYNMASYCQLWNFCIFTYELVYIFSFILLDYVGGFLCYFFILSFRYYGSLITLLIRSYYIFDGD